MTHVSYKIINFSRRWTILHFWGIMIEIPPDYYDRIEEMHLEMSRNFIVACAGIFNFPVRQGPGVL